MAKLGQRGRPSATLAMKSKCRECVNWNRIDCEIPDCPLYYWMPYREMEPDTSWVEANGYASRENHAAWKKRTTDESE